MYSIMYQFLILLQSIIILSKSNGFLILNKPNPFLFDDGDEERRIEDWKKVDVPCVNYGQISNGEKIKFLQKRSNTDTPMRRSSLNKNFMRFGRSDFSQDEKCCKQNHLDEFSTSVSLALDGDDSIMKSRRNFDNNFMRFGRNLKEGFIRFGRPAKEGRTVKIVQQSMQPTDEADSVRDSFSRTVKNDNFMRFGKSTKNQSDFVRHGKSNGKNDNFIRFGKKGDKNGTGFLRFRSDYRDATERENDGYDGERNSDVVENEWKSDTEPKTKRRNEQISHPLDHYFDADLTQHTTNAEIMNQDAATTHSENVEDMLKRSLEDKFTLLSYIKPFSLEKGDSTSNTHKWELGSLKSTSPYLPLFSTYWDRSLDSDYPRMESLPKRKQNGSSFIRFG